MLNILSEIIFKKLKIKGKVNLRLFITSSIKTTYCSCYCSLTTSYVQIDSTLFIYTWIIWTTSNVKQRLFPNGTEKFLFALTFLLLHWFWAEFCYMYLEWKIDRYRDGRNVSISITSAPSMTWVSEFYSFFSVRRRRPSGDGHGINLGFICYENSPWCLWSTSDISVAILISLLLLIASQETKK